tara:strand:- start:107 stop:304 length:198 start_codon:yes stop_codon:yes gene_type:complete
MTVFQYLELRFQWEEIVQDYKIDSFHKDGTIENLKWYMENGVSKNRFRHGFKESQGIAMSILEKA